jgi:rhamnosyltransferase
MAGSDPWHGVDIGVAVITHRSCAHLPRCLPPLLASPVPARVLVVNSSSGDGTVELAQAMGAGTLVVPRAEFNHGLTRELARKRLGTPVVVMLTPDAYPEDDGFLERLTAPVRAGLAAVAYGRQLPREGAGPIERFARAFNYPAASQLRSLADWPRYGSYTHFCSNACAAWSNAALDEIGGFPATLVSEETIAAARLLARGERIAYVAEATVRHSHAYGPLDEFRRHFDIGWTRALFRQALIGRERDERRGAAFAKALIAALLRDEPGLLPSAVVSLASRWVGYRCGLLGTAVPVPLARRLSSQDFFWSSVPLHSGALAAGRA